MVYQSAQEYMFYEGLYEGSKDQASIDQLEWELSHWPLFFDNTRYIKFKDIYRDGYLYGMEIEHDDAWAILRDADGIIK